jgi:hypothetical protein
MYFLPCYTNHIYHATNRIVIYIHSLIFYSITYIYVVYKTILKFKCWNVVYSAIECWWLQKSSRSCKHFNTHIVSTTNNHHISCYWNHSIHFLSIIVLFYQSIKSFIKSINQNQPIYCSTFWINFTMWCCSLSNWTLLLVNHLLRANIFELNQ